MFFQSILRTERRHRFGKKQVVRSRFPFTSFPASSLHICKDYVLENENGKTSLLHLNAIPLEPIPTQNLRIKVICQRRKMDSNIVSLKPWFAVD